MINKNPFYENVSIIVEPNGNEIDVKRISYEAFHFQLIKRIDREIMPGIIDAFPQDIRNYTGYEIACLTSLKDAIIIPVNLYQKGIMLLAVSEDASPEQLKTLENLMKYLHQDFLYLIVTRKNENVIPDVINAYQFPNNTKKTLAFVSELKNIEELTTSGKSAGVKWYFRMI